MKLHSFIPSFFLVVAASIACLAPPLARAQVTDSTTMAPRLLDTQATAVASATTTDLNAVKGDYVHVTGTTTITALGTRSAGSQVILVFDGALTLTYNGSSLILPGGANITTAAGDRAIMRSEGSGNWRCVAYVKASGEPVRGQTASATTAVGYTTGAGGAVTQATNSATQVTLNTTTGQITTVALTTAGAAEEAFVCNNSTVSATDVIAVSTTYAGAGKPIVFVTNVGSGVFTVNITNVSGSALDAVLVINFAVINGVTS